MRKAIFGNVNGKMQIEYCDDQYWSDIVRLVQAFWASGDAEKIEGLLTTVNDQVYEKFIARRIDANPRELHK